MAKIANYRFTAYADAGDDLHLDLTTTVSSDGFFNIVLPDLEGFKECLAEIKSSDKELYAVGFSSNRNKKDMITGRCLRTLQSAIAKTARKYVEAEIVKERVIRLHYSSEAHYVSDPEGGIHINGEIIKESSGGKYSYQDDGVQWQGDQHFSLSSAPYSISLYARVVDKVRHIRGGSEVTKFERPEEESLQDWGRRLNAFVHMGHDRDVDHKIIEIPYTEESAEILVSALLGICRADQILKAAFESQESILQMHGKLEKIKMLSGPPTNTQKG